MTSVRPPLDDMPITNTRQGLCSDFATQGLSIRGPKQRKRLFHRPSDISAAGFRPQYQVWSNRYAPGHWVGGPCHSIRGGGHGQPKLRLDELPTDGGKKFRVPIWWSRGVAVTITRFADCPVWPVSLFYRRLRGCGLHLPTSVTQRLSGESRRA